MSIQNYLNRIESDCANEPGDRKIPSNECTSAFIRSCGICAWLTGDREETIEKIEYLRFASGGLIVPLSHPPQACYSIYSVELTSYNFTVRALEVTRTQRTTAMFRCQKNDGDIVLNKLRR